MAGDGADKKGGASQPMTGLLQHLTGEQRRAVLAYDGPENHGDPALRLTHHEVREARLALRRALAQHGVPGLPTARDFMDAGAPATVAAAIATEIEADTPFEQETMEATDSAIKEYVLRWNGILKAFGGPFGDLFPRGGR